MEKIKRLKIGEWEIYRSLRLESLCDSPDAFSSKYEDALARSDESWITQANSTAAGADRATFICINEKPCGLGALYRDDNDPEVGELIQMWVSETHRGSAAASALLNEIFSWAASNGFLRVKAEVMKHNVRAIRFYRKLGFAPSEDMTSHSDSSVMLTKELVGADDTKEGS